MRHCSQAHVHARPCRQPSRGALQTAVPAPLPPPLHMQPASWPAFLGGTLLTEVLAALGSDRLGALLRRAVLRRPCRRLWPCAANRQAAGWEHSMQG